MPIIQENRIPRLRYSRFARLQGRAEQDILQDTCKMRERITSVSSSGVKTYSWGAYITYNNSEDIPCALFESRPFREEDVGEQRSTLNEYELHLPANAPLQGNHVIECKGRTYEVRKLYDALTFKITKYARVVELQLGEKVNVFGLTGITATPTGLSVDFSVDIVNGITPFSYFWMFGDTNNSSDATPTHVYSEAGTYLVRVQVMDSTGELQTAETEVTVS